MKAYPFFVTVAALILAGGWAVDAHYSVPAAGTDTPGAIELKQVAIEAVSSPVVGVQTNGDPQPQPDGRYHLHVTLTHTPVDGRPVPARLARLTLEERWIVSDICFYGEGC